MMLMFYFCFFFSSRRRHTRYWRDWSSDVCSSDLVAVSAFLEGSIRFQEIPVVIEEVVCETPVGKLESIKAVLGVDQNARATAQEKVAAFTMKTDRKHVPVSVGTRDS